MKKLILSFTILSSISLTAQNISFTDANFKAALISHNPVIDTSGDGEISMQEAAYANHSISVSGENISDLTGLEYFINIPQFYCSNNNISSIDITTLSALTLLSCSDNIINSINITQNPGLLRLTIANNNLTTLDASQNTGMLLLSCFNNQLTTINVQNGNNTNMQFNATSNPNACIQVDDVNYSQTAWNWFKDASATYALSCSTTGIDEERVSFNFYPNPVIDELTVCSPYFSSLYITDLSGKIILTSYDSIVSLNTLKKGVYFLTVYDLNGNFSTEKIIKQ